MVVLKRVSEIPIAVDVTDDDYIILQKPGMTGSNPDPDNDDTNILTLGSLRTNLLGSNRIFISTSTPEGQDLNDLWFNPLTKIMRYWNSLSWVVALRDPSVVNLSDIQNVDFTGQTPLSDGWVLTWSSSLQRWKASNSVERIDNLTSSYILNRANHTGFTPLTGINPSLAASEDIIAFNGTSWAVRAKYNISELDIASATTGQIPLSDGSNWIPSALPIASIDKTNAVEGESIAFDGTDWIRSYVPRVSLQTADFNAVGGFLYLVDTSGGLVVASLPTSPSNGTIIYFCDHGSTTDEFSGFKSNALVLMPSGGDNIQGFNQLNLTSRNDLVSIAYANGRWSIYNAASSLTEVYTSLLNYVPRHNIFENGTPLPGRTSLNFLLPFDLTFNDDEIQLAIDETYFNHNTLTNYDPNEHIDHTAVELIAGVALSGGGFITSNVTFNVDPTELTEVTDLQLSDLIIVQTSSGVRKARLDNTPSKGLKTTYTSSPSVNAEIGYLYLLDGTTTFNLPVGVNGRTVALSDYGSFANNPVTVVPNGADTVLGKSSLILTTEGQALYLTYYTGKWVLSGGETGGNNLSVIYKNDATLNAQPGFIYLLDGTDVVNLPNGTDGDRVTISDYGAAFDTNPVTINAYAGETIHGLSSITINSQYATVQLVFHDNKWVFYGTESFLDIVGKLEDNSQVDEVNLTGDKALIESDGYYQLLNPNGADRVVALNLQPHGEVVNDSDGTYGLIIRETLGGADLITLSNVSGYKYVEFHRKADSSYYVKVGGAYI